jgi:hypothetical protein
MRQALLIGVVIVGGGVFASDAAASDPQHARTLRQHHADKLLLDFFRRLTLGEHDQKRIGHLIHELDAGVYKQREQATTDLIAMGPSALPLLRQGLRDAPLEVRRRLERCIKAVEPADWSETIAATAQFVKARRPDAGVPVLLDYLPFAPEDAIDAVLDALCRLAVRDGKVDPLLVAALQDPLPSKRAAGAVIVGAYGQAEQRTVVQGLLEDADATVRFRAAEGLLAGRDRSAVPVLIALLGQGNYALAEWAEGLLMAVAGASAPPETLAEDSTARARCQAAWLAWWSKHKDQLDLTQVPALQLLDGPHVPRLEGTTWAGGEFGDDTLCTYYFGKYGKLTVTYNNLTLTNASWKQNGRKLYFEINGRYRETTGVIKNGVIQCEAWNVKGVRWTVTLKKVKV